MDSSKYKNYSKEINSFSYENKKNKSFNHRKGLIESIPKLNFQEILKSELKPKIIKKSRNNKITLDKSLFSSSKNNSDKSNSEYNDDKKYETDNDLNIKSHNNIFDFYDIDKNDTNNSTTLETAHLLSSTNINLNKKNMINKTVRKKKIINLKSFLKDKKVKSRNKFSLDKFVSSLNNIFRRQLLKISFRKLYEYHKGETSIKISKDDEIKLKNLEEKVVRSIKKIKDDSNRVNDNIIPFQMKSIDNNNDYYNNMSEPNSNSARNYFYYIEQFSSRYNREKEEDFLNEFKYKPTNISFVIKNFSNNNIFNNIQNEFKLFQKHCKMNVNNGYEIDLYKKYYGGIEAINEEDNESEDIKCRISSKRNEDKSLNKSVGEFNHSNSFSYDESLDCLLNKSVANMKFHNNKRTIKNKKSKIYIIESPKKDNFKFDINISKTIIDKISEIDFAKNKIEKKILIINNNMNSFCKDLIRKPNNISNSHKNTILKKSCMDLSGSKKKFGKDKVKEKISKKLILNENSSKKFMFSLLIFLAFIIKFFLENLG